jgi:hypothetical protein
MTTEEKELHEFFKSILSEKAWAKFQRMMELQREKYAPAGYSIRQVEGELKRKRVF